MILERSGSHCSGVRPFKAPFSSRRSTWCTAVTKLTGCSVSGILGCHTLCCKTIHVRGMCGNAQLELVQFAVAARIEIMSTSIAYEDHANAPWLSGRMEHRSCTAVTLVL